MYHLIMSKLCFWISKSSFCYYSFKAYICQTHIICSCSFFNKIKIETISVKCYYNLWFNWYNTLYKEFDSFFFIFFIKYFIFSVFFFINMITKIMNTFRKLFSIYYKSSNMIINLKWYTHNLISLIWIWETKFFFSCFNIESECLKFWC